MTQPFTSTPTGNLKEDVNFQELSQGTIRSEGREGQHIEGGLVLNEDGADVDFRVEGDTEPNALFVDGATGRVGIGTASPTRELEVAGTFRIEGGAGASIIEQRAASGSALFRQQATAAEWIIRDQVAGNSIFRVLVASPGDSLRVEPSGVALFGAGSFGGGAGVVYIANATTVPTSDPSGGGILFCEGGALKYRGSSGTVTELGPA